MNCKLLHDEETNVVYISPWLNNKKDRHPDFYARLITLFNEIGIETRELKSTNDFWARDYMPVQLSKNEFLKYHYYPDYLVNINDITTITNASNVIRGMGLNCRSTELIIDGGNMVPCSQYLAILSSLFPGFHMKMMYMGIRMALSSGVVIIEY